MAQVESMPRLGASAPPSAAAPGTTAAGGPTASNGNNSELQSSGSTSANPDSRNPLISVYDPSLTSGYVQRFSPASANSTGGASAPPLHLPSIHNIPPPPLHQSGHHHLAPLLHAAASADFNSGSTSSSAVPKPSGVVVNAGSQGDEIRVDDENDQGTEPHASGSGKGGKRKRLPPGDSEEPNSSGGEPAGEDDGPRPLKNTKRAAQNRAAQRAFRERKEQHVKDLEVKAALLPTLESQLQSLQARLHTLEATPSERSSFLNERQHWDSDRARWDADRRSWDAEREEWRRQVGDLRAEIEGLKGALGEARRMNVELRGAAANAASNVM